MSLWVTITIVLAVLKLYGLIDISWLGVCLPILIAIAVPFIIAFVVAFVVAAIQTMRSYL